MRYTPGRFSDTTLYQFCAFAGISVFSGTKYVRVKRSGIDTIKYHT